MYGDKIVLEMRLPELVGDVNTSAIIVEWLKKEGDEIKEGEPIIVVETAKANIEVEAPTSGILHRIIAQIEQEVKIGEIIAVITDPDEKIIKTPVSSNSINCKPQNFDTILSEKKSVEPKTKIKSDDNRII